MPTVSPQVEDLVEATDLEKVPDGRAWPSYLEAPILALHTPMGADEDPQGRGVTKRH